MSSTDTTRHTLFDDLQGILTGTLVLSIGLAYLKSAELLTGGTAGVAFLVHYTTGWNFGLTLFIINIPFYILGVIRRGWLFTFKTLVSVSLVGLFTELTPAVLLIEFIDPVFAAIGGGLLIGTGMLIVFRHNASLGGFNILALVLQDRYGISAGKTLMLCDSLVVAAGLFLMPLWLLIISILGAVLISFVISVNHKPGRYNGF